MKIQEIQCKTALSRSTLPGLTYSLNPYRGCGHNCAYCYAPNVLRIPRERWGDVIEIKKNILAVLTKEVKTKKPGIVGISTVTDPYQPIEQKYTLTRLCLEQLLQYDFPVHIQTKSSLITRDIDLLSQFTDAQVMFSIGTLHDNERKLLEPFTSSIQDRFAALKKCANAGVRVAVFFGPVYLTTKIEEIPQMIDTVKNAGASELWIDKLRMKPGIWENIKKQLFHNQEIIQIYSHRIFEENNYYPKIREEIQKKGKEQNLKIIDAF